MSEACNFWILKYFIFRLSYDGKVNREIKSSLPFFSLCSFILSFFLSFSYLFFVLFLYPISFSFFFTLLLSFFLSVYFFFNHLVFPSFSFFLFPSSLTLLLSFFYIPSLRRLFLSTFLLLISLHRSFFIFIFFFSFLYFHQFLSFFPTVPSFLFSHPILPPFFLSFHSPFSFCYLHSIQNWLFAPFRSRCQLTHTWVDLRRRTPPPMPNDVIINCNVRKRVGVTKTCHKHKRSGQLISFSQPTDHVLPIL